MGMFDYINFKMPCPVCGAELKEFQSKDGLCIMGTLEFWEVDNFYSYCGHCRSRIEFNPSVPREPRPITDYRMTVEKRGK